ARGLFETTADHGPRQLALRDGTFYFERSPFQFEMLASADFGAVRQLSCEPLGLAADATYLYWSCADGIYRGARTGGAGSQIVAFARPYFLYLDATTLYFLDGNGQIRTAPIGGGSVGASIAARSNPNLP